MAFANAQSTNTTNVAINVATNVATNGSTNRTSYLPIRTTLEHVGCPCIIDPDNFQFQKITAALAAKDLPITYGLLGCR